MFKLAKLKSFEYHNKLEKHLFNQEDQMNILVLCGLKLLVLKFVDYLRGIGLFIQKSDLIDIVVHGSMVNYYYDKYSDIDVCLIVNLSTLYKRLDGIDMESMFRALVNSFFLENNINIVGHRVDLSIIDPNLPIYQKKHILNKIRGNSYSILKNTWISYPKKLDNKQITHIRQQTLKYYKKIYDAYCNINYNYDMKDMTQVITNLSIKRFEYVDFEPTQPVHFTSMAFRLLRRTGILQKIEKNTIQQSLQNI